MVHHIAGFLFRNFQAFLQIRNDILKHIVDVPVPDGYIRRFFYFLRRLVADEIHIFGFRHSLIVFGLRNHFLIVHFPQNCLLALFVRLRMLQRRVCRRVLRNSGNCRTFGQRTVLNLLIKIEICRRLNSLASAAEIDHIEVRLKNFIFGIFLFQIQSPENFFHLAGQAHLVFPRKILYKLLGNGRTSVIAALCEQSEHCAEGSAPVNALVFSEPLIFNGNDRILHIIRDLIECHPDAILAAGKAHIFLRLPILVIDVNEAGVIELKLVEIQLDAFVPHTHDKGEQGNGNNDSRNGQNRENRTEDFQRKPQKRGKRRGCVMTALPLLSGPAVRKPVNVRFSQKNCHLL